MTIAATGLQALDGTGISVVPVAIVTGLIALGRGILKIGATNAIATGCGPTVVATTIVLELVAIVAGFVPLNDAVTAASRTTVGPTCVPPHSTAIDGPGATVERWTAPIGVDLHGWWCAIVDEATTGREGEGQTQEGCRSRFSAQIHRK